MAYINQDILNWFISHNLYLFQSNIVIQNKCVRVLLVTLLEKWAPGPNQCPIPKVQFKSRSVSGSFAHVVLWSAGNVHFSRENITASNAARTLHSREKFYTICAKPRASGQRFASLMEDTRANRSETRHRSAANVIVMRSIHHATLSSWHRKCHLVMKLTVMMMPTANQIKIDAK